MLKKLTLIIIFLFMFCPQLFGNSNQFEMLHHKYFLIKYIRNSEKFALQVVSLIDQNLYKMEDFYNIKMNFPVTIIIVESSQDFKLYSQSSLPDWTGAAYLSSHDVILLKDQTLVNSRLNLERDFLHELSHLFFQKKFQGKNVPLWYNEGLAEYLSGESIDLHSGLVLSNAIWAKTIIPFIMMDSLLSFSQHRAELAYAQSLSAVLFLKEKLKNKKWNDFHDNVIQDGWHSAFLNYLNMDEIDFEIAWYRNIDDKYRWMFILNVENLIWVMLLLVLMIGMYLIRYRNKKLLRKWEYEEKAYGIENSYFSKFESGHQDSYSKEE